MKQHNINTYDPLQQQHKQTQEHKATQAITKRTNRNKHKTQARHTTTNSTKQVERHHVARINH